MKRTSCACSGRFQVSRSLLLQEDAVDQLKSTNPDGLGWGFALSDSIYFALSCLTFYMSRDMLWEEELEAKRIQDDEDRKRKVGQA